MDKQSRIPELHSRQSTAQMIAALLWLPVHVLLLPRLLSRIIPGISPADLNVVVYGVGAVFMVLSQWRFLRRDFDALCDHPGRVLIQICVCYGAMLLFNMAVAGLMLLITGEGPDNPNNAVIVDLAQGDYGKISALAIFLAPIVEELIFRAGIFGGLRRVSRLAAFLVSIAAFSVYHVWGYAVNDPMTWIYVLQYIPVSYLLCRCYERSDSIWGSIFFHMLVNGISLRALTLLEELQ